MPTGARTSARSWTRSPATGPLRLGTDDALETVWALTSPELHQLLRGERGWTREHHRSWLAEPLARLLLPGDGGR